MTRAGPDIPQNYRDPITKRVRRRYVRQVIKVKVVAKQGKH